MRECDIWNLVNSTKPAYYVENNGHVFLVMPTIRQMSFDEPMNKARLPEAYLSILLATAIAIENMHLKLVLHKDITGDNLRVSRFSDRVEAFVIDFGQSQIKSAADFSPRVDIKLFCETICVSKIIRKEQHPILHQLLEDVVHHNKMISLSELINHIRVEFQKCMASFARYDASATALVAGQQSVFVNVPPNGQVTAAALPSFPQSNQLK